MESFLPTPERPALQDEAFCPVCSGITLEGLERGFILPSPKDLISLSRTCRLCYFISAGWPRAINSLIQLPPDRSPSLKLCAQSDEVNQSYDRGKHRQILPLSRTKLPSGLVLLIDYSLKNLSPDNSEWRILGRISILREPGGNITIDHDDNQKTCCPIFPPDSAVNFERVKEWLDTCVSNHMQCRKTIAGAEVDDATSNSILPSRVISVGWQDSDTPQLLISNGKSGRYVALSYCWGDDSGNSLVTTLSNISEMQQAIPLALLPNTIQDAIKVTRMIGVKYLWVDSICIVQDDEDDFRKESENMGRIYQQAILTIAATSARKSSEGLFTQHLMDVEISSRQTLDIRLRRGGTSEMFDDIVLQIQGYPDHQALRPFDAELSKCEWSKRGWVVQERLLSRRILHYASEQLFWECQEGVFAESCKEALPESSLVHSKRSMFNRIVRETTLAARTTASSHQLQTVRAAAYISLDKISDAFGITRWSVEEARHRFWERVVQTYNICNLTYEKDKLPAISGLAREIGVFTRQTYFQGVWLEDISRGLYWHGSDQNVRLEKIEAAGAPTWSWASWKGPLRMATYLAEYDTGRPRITEEMLKSVRTNPSQPAEALDIYAHFWKAQMVDSLLPCETPTRDQQWMVQDWWTPTSFVEDLFSGFPDWNCCELEGKDSDSRSRGLRGLVSFDHPRFEDYSGKELTCIVLNTVRIRNLRSEKNGYGYYQLIVGESSKVPGAYERLGVGISISAEKDRIFHGWLGRESPGTNIFLV